MWSAAGWTDLSSEPFQTVGEDTLGHSAVSTLSPLLSTFKGALEIILLN